MPECDGRCKDMVTGGCRGDVRRVHVWGQGKDWGEFSYCERAISDDEENGFTVEIVGENDADSPGGE